MILFVSFGCVWKDILSKLCQKYDDLAQVDKLAAVAKKVDTVKLVMQENIDVALQNCVKLEAIEIQAGELFLCTQYAQNHHWMKYSPCANMNVQEY